MENKNETLTTLKVGYSSELYKIVDCLNRTLRKDNLMFGLALEETNEEQAVFTIYRT